MNDITKDYVFLSYSHKDDIEPLLMWFDSKGYNVVYDAELSVGDLWDMKVRRYINNIHCKGVLSLLSRAALISTPILKESDYIKLFNKQSACILLDDCSLVESFSLITNEYEKETAQAIMEYFPPSKVFIKQRDVFTPNNKLEATLEKWGIYIEAKSQGLGFAPIDKYTSEIKGETERLQRQQRGYYDFDKTAIDSVINDIDKTELVVLDLGCSSGETTSTRFRDKRFKTVIGIDYNSSDIDKAIASNYGDKYHFYQMDIESDGFILELSGKLRSLDIEKIDIVFMALTLHHLKEPNKLLFRLYDVFSDDGRIIIRGSDDGGKLCYPESELMADFFKRYNELVNSVTDRCNGRKLYKQLLDTGYLNVRMKYQITDTCEKSRAEKVNFYKVGFGFREVRLQEISEKNPNNPKIQKEVEWQLNALSKIKELFGKRDFWYSNVSYIAIATVR